MTPSRAALAAGLLLAVASAATAGPEPTEAAEQVRTCVAENAPQLSTVLSVRLTVSDATGEVATARFKVYWRRLPDGERRLLMRFHEPDDLMDSALLIELPAAGRPSAHLYLPAAGRVRRLKSSDELEAFLGRARLGMDEVEALIEPVDASEIARVSDTEVSGRPVWELEQHAATDSRYPVRLSWVDRERCVLVRTDLHDEEGLRLRRMQLDPERVSLEGKTWFPRLLRIGGPGDLVTELVVEEVEVDVPVAPALLSVRAMEQPGR